MKKTNKGITLVALVVTIIILLILVGISITTLAGKNGILSKSIYAKEETRGASVEEEKDLWEANLEADKYTKNKNSQTLEELLNELVNKKLLKEEEKDIIIGNDEKGIEETGEITIGTRTIVFGDPIRTLKEMKVQCNIDETYTINDITNNKEKSLEKILENSRATKYIVKSHIDDLVLSEQAMTLLGKNKIAINNIIKSDELCKKVVDSKYRKNFSEYIVYNKDTLIGTTGGRSYYKANDGFALAAAYNAGGGQYVLVSKDEKSTWGWCTYNASFIGSTRGEIQYNNETWYYTDIPYCWWGEYVIDTTNNCKFIGEITPTDIDTVTREAAQIALNDFFNTNK